MEAHASSGVTSTELTESTQESENTSTEYETQHFGFTPITLVNGMYNTVCDLYREALKAFSQTCSQTCPFVMTEEELRSARHAVSEKIDGDVCMLFDKLEHFLFDTVFSIPDHVVLPEDSCHLKAMSEQERLQMEQKISDLKQHIVAVKYANAVLRQNLKETEALRKSIDSLLKQTESSDGSLSQFGGKDFKDWISYYGEMLKDLIKNKE